MPHLPQPAVAPPARVAGERRASLRYPINRKAGWTVTVFVDQAHHTATVRDLSTAGIGILMRESLQPGTLVTIELTNASRLFCCTRLTRIAHTNREPNGAYLLGCEFSTPLTYDQIYALLCK